MNNFISQLSEQEKLDRDSLFLASAVSQKKMFFFTSFKRIPMMQDLHTGEVCHLEKLINYDPKFITDYMTVSENDIVALELNGKRLMKYNTVDKICTYFELDYNGRNCDNYALFTSWGRKLYVFPRYGDKFIIIDLEKEKVQKNKILSSKIQANRKNKEKDTMSYFWCGCQLENKAWLFSKQGNMAVVYDMNSSMWQEYEIPGNIDNCVSVMPYEDKFYLLNSKGIVYCWDAKCALVEIIADCSNSSGDNTRFSQIGVSGKRIFILPALEKDIYYVDLKTRQINKYETYPKGFRYCGPENWSKFYGYCEDEECYYFAMRSANFMLVLNKQSGKEKWIKPRQLLREEYIKVYFNYNRSLLQETECNLEDVLDYLDYDSANIQKKKDISLGKQVWRQVK